MSVSTNNLQFLNDEGTPLAGQIVRVFHQGTNNYAIIRSPSGGQRPNPITLNSSGHTGTMELDRGKYDAYAYPDLTSTVATAQATIYSTEEDASSGAILTRVTTFEQTTRAQYDQTLAQIASIKSVALTPGQIQFSIAPLSAPAFLLLDGQQVSRNDYRTLYESLIAAGLSLTTPGDQFVLPDLTSRFPYVASSPGATGGSASRTLTIDQIPPHKHTVKMGTTASPTGTLALPADIANTTAASPVTIAGGSASNNSVYEGDDDDPTAVPATANTTSIDITPPFYSLRAYVYTGRDS